MNKHYQVEQNGQVKYFTVAKEAHKYAEAAAKTNPTAAVVLRIHVGQGAGVEVWRSDR